MKPLTKIGITLLTLVSVGSLTANALLYMRYNRNRPLMYIGKDMVPFSEYQDAVDSEHGREVLKRIALGKMVLSAAERENVMPTDDDVEKRIATGEKKNPKPTEDAKRDPYLADQFRKGVKTQLALENLCIKGVTVSDAELQAFWEKNKHYFALPPKANSTMVIANNSTSAQTAKALLEQKDIRPSVIARQPGLGVVGVNGFNPDFRTLSRTTIKTIADGMKNLSVGQVAVLPASGLYFVVRVESKSPEVIPSLDSIKEQVKKAALLSKSPTRDQTLGRLYRESGVKFEIPKYAVFFTDVEDSLKEADEQNKDPQNKEPKSPTARKTANAAGVPAHSGSDM